MRFNLAGLDVPETWDTLDNFIHWYRINGYPFRVPQESKTFVTDVSYSMIVFQQDVYAVELYMGSPDLQGTKHAHPFEHRTLICGGEVYGRRGRQIEEDPPFSGPLPIGSLSSKVNPGEWHQLTAPTGFILLTFSKWVDKSHITSAIMAYQGASLGPIHDILLNKGT